MNRHEELQKLTACGHASGWVPPRSVVDLRDSADPMIGSACTVGEPRLCRTAFQSCLTQRYGCLRGSWGGFAPTAPAKNVHPAGLSRCGSAAYVIVGGSYHRIRGDPAWTQNRADQGRCRPTLERMAVVAARTPVLNVGSMTGANCGEWFIGTVRPDSSSSGGWPPKNQ